LRHANRLPAAQVPKWIIGAPGGCRLQGNVSMTSRWNGKRKFWTIVLTVLVTIIGVALAMNFAIPEKRLERKVDHK